MCLLEGLKRLGQSSEQLSGGVEGAATNGVAGEDTGEATVGERAAGGGVRERERGAGGSIEGPLD